jgi:hypothetical protein
VPLHDLQRQAQELGRLRIGATVVRNGKARPTKLDTFRFTTPRRLTAEAVAELYDGTVGPWEPDGRSPQWEVLTKATELGVTLPAGRPLTQWHELWTGAGCVRRCDGITETLSGRPCLCPSGQARAVLAASGEACKATSRLSVILPDLPGVGVWVLATRGYYAAVELAGAAELLHTAAVRGIGLAATLRLDQRETRRPGQPVQRYGVPVLDVHNTARELLSGEGLQTLPAPARGPAALTGSGNTPALESGPDPEAQVVADHLLDARTRSDVAALGERAVSGHLLDAVVEAPDRSLVPLRELLTARHRQLPD